MDKPSIQWLKPHHWSCPWSLSFSHSSYSPSVSKSCWFSLQYAPWICSPLTSSITASLHGATISSFLCWIKSLLASQPGSTLPIGPWSAFHLAARVGLLKSNQMMALPAFHPSKALHCGALCTDHQKSRSLFLPPPLRGLPWPPSLK